MHCIKSRRSILSATAGLLLLAPACSDNTDPPGKPALADTTGTASTTDGASSTTDTSGTTSSNSTSASSTTTGGASLTSTSNSSSTGSGTTTATNTSSASSGGAGGSTSTSSTWSGGAGGSGGVGGGSGGGGSLPVQPSAGCNSGNSSPGVGSAGNPLMVSGHQYYVKLPSGYDGSTPYLAIFMFNPTGNPIDWAEKNAGFESNGAADGAIRIYPHPANSSSGWGSGDVSFFQPLYDTVIADYCVDESRMFAAGESSGGDFSSILGCEFGDKLRSVAPCATKPVGGYPLNVSQRDCVGEVTAVVIHGANDNVVGPENGPATRDFYTELNHCGDSSEPVEGYTDSMSNCVEYQGCDEGFPVFWCLHNDPEYSGTNHGCPHFAADFLWELWSSY